MFRAGKFRARIAQGAEDIRACQRLRYLTFIEERGLASSADPHGLDADEFDPACSHLMVEETASGQLVCCFRMLPLESGSEIGRSYSAKYYELSNLATFPGRMVEMGRFCIHPAWRDPNILRVAWGAMTAYVDREKVELLFGCSSFYGNDAETYADAFALLKEKHIAPKRWLPRVKAPKVFRFARAFRLRKPDLKLALKRMPPLLRTYLTMGGWVSDHAVIDTELNTLHVFTGVEIGKVPPGRARILRRSPT
ncbi:GNAT family N-acetyltransferase [Paralimibaculum aggregatum]|uniref:L-ornithine N(alpha)-acyltransferase n=1 Tax=Paralimibaculum aggregatum TaxID=3036245 RepID=A0ABQ6LKX5_9RHOB|nr:GNAT family N-acetyltransferase [Limibaculum sp. NKW23]GMG81898.1 GNAT family N-acetyltransferase [Limibaculum sp. NKW23]